MEESGKGLGLTKRRTWLSTLLVALIGAGAASLYPARSTVCPAWTIRIVDTAGNPLRGAFVRQVWKDYSVESASHEQDARTDENGYVSFPERTIRSELAGSNSWRHLEYRVAQCTRQLRPVRTRPRLRPHNWRKAARGECNLSRRGASA